MILLFGLIAIGAICLEAPLIAGVAIIALLGVEGYRLWRMKYGN